MTINDADNKFRTLSNVDQVGGRPFSFRRRQKFESAPERPWPQTTRQHLELVKGSTSATQNGAKFN